MKYIKSFESLVTLELDRDDMMKMMDYAMTKNKVVLIRSLLENGYDPNWQSHKYDSLLLRSVSYDRIDLDRVKLFIEFGYDLNAMISDMTIIEHILDNCISTSDTLIKAAKKLNNVSDVLVLIIKSGAEITDNFMFELNTLRKRRNIGATANFLYNRIIEECPEEYDRYLVDSDAKKYNI